MACPFSAEVRLASSRQTWPDVPPGYGWVEDDEDDLLLRLESIPLEQPYYLNERPLPLPAPGTLWLLKHDQTLGSHFVLRRVQDCDEEELLEIGRVYNYTALAPHARSTGHLHHMDMSLPRLWIQPSAECPLCPSEYHEHGYVLLRNGMIRRPPSFARIPDTQYHLQVDFGSYDRLNSAEYASVCALHRPNLSRRVFYREFQNFAYHLRHISHCSPMTSLYRPPFRDDDNVLYMAFVPDRNHRFVGISLKPDPYHWLCECDLTMCLRVYLGLLAPQASSIWRRFRQIYPGDANYPEEHIMARMVLVHVPLEQQHPDYSYEQWVHDGLPILPLIDAGAEFSDQVTSIYRADQSSSP